MSLYDYFGVANTQELYDLITNDDPRVDDLQNFLTYAKQEISYESPKVFNFEALFKLVNSEQLIPRDNEAYIIGGGGKTRVYISEGRGFSIKAGRTTEVGLTFPESNTQVVRGYLRSEYV